MTPEGTVEASKRPRLQPAGPAAGLDDLVVLLHRLQALLLSDRTSGGDDDELDTLLVDLARLQSTLKGSEAAATAFAAITDAQQRLQVRGWRCFFGAGLSASLPQRSPADKFAHPS